MKKKDRCEVCVGSGEAFNEGDPCHVCGGSGKKTTVEPRFGYAICEDCEDVAPAYITAPRVGCTGFGHWEEVPKPKSLVDRIWNSKEVMALNAELGLSMAELVNLYHAFQDME